MLRLSAVLLVFSSSVALAEPGAGFRDNAFQIWADGFKLKVGAILQYDGRFFVDEGTDRHVDTFAFRSTRIDLAATFYDHWDVRLVPDFAGSKLVVQDAYIDAHYTEVFKLRFGKMKVPFGLERLQEERNTTFTERGLPTQISPNRDLGVQAFGELLEGVLAYQGGIFNGVADGGSGDVDASSDKDYAARIFVRPVPKYEIGIGGAMTYGEQHGHVASNTDVGAFKTPGQTTFFTFKTGTSALDTVLADGIHWRAAGQGYAYVGPVGVLSEYVRSAQDIKLGSTHETATFEAWQVLGQWVLTGDRASYRGVTPKHPFDPVTGEWGAFDVAARVGELRVVDAGTLNEGFADPAKSVRRVWQATGGADWYPNRTIRFMVDVDHLWYTRGAKTGDRQSETSIIGRVQAAF
jgi:phosphate-selective porin OprO/OprP